MEHADVVIVGAGVIGLSVGYHLLARDPRMRVAIFEEAPMAGTRSTAKATGGIRHQFSQEPLVRLSQLSIAEYRSFEPLTGVDVELREVGYLLFATSPQGASKLKRAVDVQRQCGVRVEGLDRNTIAARWPFLHHDDIEFAAWTSEDGHANPYSAVSGYLRAFQSRGGILHLNEPITAIQLNGGRVQGIATSQRSVQTAVLVNAAGVSAALVGAMAGLHLPVASYRRQVAVLSPGRFGHPTPIMMDNDSGWYMHVQAEGAILLGGIDKDTHPGVHEVVDPALTTAVIEIGLSRVPRLAETSLIRSYSGLRALTPDDLPILGPTRSLAGYYCACGLAGHGFMHAPAVGMLLRDWILDGEPHGFETAAVAPDRFGAGGAGRQGI